MNKHLKLPLSVLLAVGAVATLSASIISLGPIILGGTGLGSVNTILTVQGTPTESGCVAWNGASDVVGPAACPGGISGGNEKTGASQTQTRSIAELGLVNAASIRIIMNANEPAANGITLDQLVLRIYDASTGAVLFSDSIPAAIIFPTTFSGTGSSGFGFALNAAQAAAAQSAFANTANRLGLSASASGTAGGGGTFFVANVTTIVTPTGCPTITLLPATLPNATVGVPYNQTIVGSGGTAPYTFTLTGGTLPASLPLTLLGLLTGTPTTTGTPGFTIRGTDANGCFADRSFTITVLLAVPTLPRAFVIVLALGLTLAGYDRLRRRARIVS